MLTIHYIKEFALLHADLIYVLIFLGVIIEGEIAVIIAGIFAHLGSINILVAIGAIFLGGGIKSIIGYTLGSYLQSNYSNSAFLTKIENRMHLFFPNFRNHPFWSIFLSRFLIFGIYWFALIFNGYKKIPVKIFIKAEICSLVSWTIIMVSLGYFFSYAAISISHNIRNFVGLIFVFFMMFFILEKIISFFIRIFQK